MADNDDNPDLINDPVTGMFKPGHRKKGGRPPGVPNKINQTTKQAMDEAAQIVGGKEGKVGVFVKAGQKDIVAFANMIARTMPLEVKAEVNNVGSLGDVIIETIPHNHMKCPDGNYRPLEEAKLLWDEVNVTTPAIIDDKLKLITASEEDAKFADGELIEASEDETAISDREVKAKLADTDNVLLIRWKRPKPFGSE